jgi:hypothetical protein
VGWTDTTNVWIRRVATLCDTALEEELKLINKNTINAFARDVGRTRRPEVDSHTFRCGSYMKLIPMPGEGELMELVAYSPADESP